MTGPRAPVTVPMISRMQELKDLRISVEAIARIVTHDWKVEPAIKGGTVRHYTESSRHGLTVEARRGIVGIAVSGPVENLRRIDPKPSPLAQEPTAVAEPAEWPRWAKARYADNEKVAQWLESEGKPEAAAQMRKRKNPRSTFWALDAKLTSLGLLVEYLPDDVWIGSDPIGDYKAKKRERRAA